MSGLCQCTCPQFNLAFGESRQKSSVTEDLSMWRSPNCWECEGSICRRGQPGWWSACPSWRRQPCWAVGRRVREGRRSSGGVAEVMVGGRWWIQVMASGRWRPPGVTYGSGRFRLWEPSYTPGAAHFSAEFVTAFKVAAKRPSCGSR